MELVNISIPNAALTALLGYLVVFLGLVLLMVVVMIQGKLMAPKKTAKPVSVPAEAEEAAPVKRDGPKASGTAGELKLYDTDPRDAAMIMAIVADATGKPLNELRFLSIREIKEEEKK
ncbi:MAG: OadG family protein [Oscillospiraceae bacterium]|nr:OadG family protein [Oscillospiraceae bacterium]